MNAESPVYLLVTLDVERDYSPNWRTPPYLTFRSILEAIPNQLAPLFRQFGVRPTYLLSPEVVGNPDCCDALRRQTGCELGAHLHGEYVLPEIATWNFCDPKLVINQMQWEYTPEVERAKLETLTQLFVQQFDFRPKSFRAGRFGIGHHSGRWLQELGYLVDSSVSPHVSWTSRHGAKFPDFRNFSEFPYSVSAGGDIWQPGQSQLLEVPVTILRPGATPLGKNAEPVWFRPWYSDAETLCQVLRFVASQPPQNGRRRPLVMMFHSEELVPGASPYPQTPSEVLCYLDALKRVFELAEKMGVRPCTLGEYHEHYFESALPPSTPLSRPSAAISVNARPSLPSRQPQLGLSPALVEPLLDAHAVQPWFKYIYRERAARWDVWRPCFWMAENHAPDAAILSLGCGVGFNLFWLAEQGFSQLHGCDIDPKAIAAGQDIARQANLPVRLWVEDCLNPKSIPQQKYAVIEALNWTHLLEGFSLEKLLNSYLHFLAEDGTFIIDVIDAAYNQMPNNEYNTADVQKPVEQRRPSEYKTRLSEEQVRRAFAAQGMEIASVIRETQTIPKTIYCARLHAHTAGEIEPALSGKPAVRLLATEEPQPHLPAGFDSSDQPRKREKVLSSVAISTLAGASRPRLLLIADVPNWIFARHCKMLERFLADDFKFKVHYQGEAFRESDFDLIYPLEWNLIPAPQIRTPAKYITSIRSHTSWQTQDFLPFVDFLGGHFQQVHVVSQRLQRIFEPFLPSVSRVSHGVDTEFFTPSQPADQSGLRLRLGWAGNRASPAKGFEQLIAPLGRLPGVELAFCGYQDRNLSLEDMRAFYNSLDAYVCSSSLEGNNNSLLEAAAMQRAIITTDNGAVPEYLRHGESALIVERELPHFIQAVITLRDDPARRVALGEQARAAVVQSFDWKNMAQHYRALFWDALAHKNNFNGEAKAGRHYIELKSGSPATPAEPASNSAAAGEHGPSESLAEAEVKVRAALAINPNGLTALKALADISLQRGHWVEGAKSCARILEQTPEDVEVNLVMAKCFFQAGDLETTRLVLNHVLELQPDNVLAKENLAALDKLQTSAAPATVVQPAKVEARETEKSPVPESKAGPAPLAEEATPICPELAAELQAAAAALQRQDLAEAYTIYQRALKAWPEHDALREVVGNVSSLLREVAAPKIELPITPAKINVAILTHNAIEYTKLCLASLARHTPFPYNVFIVDNASTDETPAWLAARTEANLFCELNPINFGVPGGRNRLLQHILPHLPPDGFVVFMDNDIEVLPGWAEFYLDFFAQHAEAGLASAVGHPFIVQGEARELLAAPVGKPTRVEVACGGFTCWIRAETIRAVGWFDECLGLFWHEDDDYSVRALSQGFEVYALPGAPVLHYEHKSGVANQGIGQGGSPANQKYLVNKWRRMGCVDAGGRIIHPKQKALPAAAQSGAEPLATEPEIRSCFVAAGASSASGSTEQPGRSVASTLRVRMPVRWLGPIFNPSGYASEAINFILPLSHRLNMGICHNNNLLSKKFLADLPEMDRNRLFALQDKFALISSGIVISHNPAHGFVVMPDAVFNIGRTMFETDRIAPSWVSCCNQMDEMWVPSQFNLETFAASGVERDKLVVMPGAVDALMYDPARHEPLPLPHRAAFNFLSIFEWSSRKAWDVLLAAYLREFSGEDDVCLYLRTYLFNKPDGDPTDAIWQRIREFAATLSLGAKPWPRIEILKNQVPMADLPRLYLAADCLLAPSRGEGWGRPQHEAMMMERPVIATNWSGNTEFMKAENSYLLDFELVEARQLEPELAHYRGHRWANPSEKHLRELMRRVQQNPAEAQAKGKLARAHVVKYFSREPVAEQIVARLQAIEQRFSTPALPAAAARVLTVTPESSKQEPEPLHVAWEGSFLDFGSLSLVNRALTCQLERQPRIHVSRLGKNIVPEHLANSSLLRETARSLKAQAPKQTQVTVRHNWPPLWQRPEAGAWVLIQPWEYGALPASWIKPLGDVDEIWVYSEYVRRVYVDAGILPDKVKVVPLGIHPGRFHPQAAPMPLPTRKSFKFLFVGGTIHRKGPDLLLRAYLQTFTAEDDVCLVIKDFGGHHVYAGQTLEAEIKAAQARPNTPEIVYLNNEFPDELLPGLYTACDCLVHPYRGEGFGLPVLEAMACGLPVIVTGGGATDDFATDEYAYRIAAARKTIENQIGDLKLVKRGWLLEPDLTALSERMRWVLANQDAARTKGLAASEHVRRNWTWERAAQTASRRLRNLVARQRAESAALIASQAVRPQRVLQPAVAKIGQLDEAREFLRQKQYANAWTATLAALALRPFHPEAVLLLAEIAQAAGDLPVARACAERALSMTPKWKRAKKFLKALSNQPQKRDLRSSPFVMPAWPARPRLSVFLIVKNEERFLGQCLQSVREVADQIVVVDTGSSDRTVEIARQHGADVHTFLWTDDFSAARNAALAHVTGDWVLMLDADEELLPEGRARLLHDIQAGSVMAYRLPLVDQGKEEEGSCFVPRLFRNAPGIFYFGRVHEQVFPSLEPLRQEWEMENRLGSAALLHHGYAEQVVQSRNKIERNLRLLERAIEEWPNEPNLLMNHGFELSRAGQIDAGLEQCQAAFRALSAQAPSQWVPELRELLLTRLSVLYVTVKQFSEIVRLFQTPLGQSAPRTASHHFLLGYALIQLKQFNEAQDHFCQCLAKRKQPALTPAIKDILKSGPHHCLAICLSRLNKAAEAEAAIQAGLAEEPASTGLRFEYAQLLAGQNRGVEALQLLYQLIQESATEPPVWILGGQIALSQPEFLQVACDWTGAAIQKLPGNADVLRQRAEALLLSQQVTEALAFWQKSCSTQQPACWAALILCELVTGAEISVVSAANEQALSREFLRWYRRLLKYSAQEVIQQLHERLPLLSQTLPSAAQVLEAAISEAQTEMPQAVPA